MIHRIQACLIAICLLPPASCLLALGSPTGADVAIVVHPKVPVDNLTMPEVKKIMMGDRQFWSANLRVTILMRAPAARERDVVLKKIYQMNDSQYKQYWIAKVFRQEAASDPKLVYSNQVATDLVARIPGAIAFIDAAQVPKDVRVLRIDGHLPGEKGYPLQ